MKSETTAPNTDFSFFLSLFSQWIPVLLSFLRAIVKQLNNRRGGGCVFYSRPARLCALVLVIYIVLSGIVHVVAVGRAIRHRPEM